MFVKEKEMERANSWIEKWSNQELINQIRMFEQIFDFEHMDDFIFLDEIYEVYELMRSECVKRIANLSPHV